MKISVLVVTENRPAFMPWLLRQYERMAWPDKELILVDSSQTAVGLVTAEATILHAPGANIPTKRNIALAAATGDAITWMDDDDWAHPERLEILAAAMGSGEAAGSRFMWFADLNDRCRRFITRRMLFGSLLVRTATAQSLPRFDEAQTRGSDLAWMQSLGDIGVVVDTPLTFSLCHDRNISNPARRHRFNREIGDIRQLVGQEAWGQTDQRLRELRERIEQQTMLDGGIHQ
jgi:glycosyltransferase involved in cell wall biosynthesis